MKWFLGVVAAFVLVAGGVFGVMAWRESGAASPPIPGGALVLPAAPAFDQNLAAQHLGAAIRFPTVSRTEGVVENPKAFDDLHAFLKKTYPKTFATLKLETVKEHTLVLTWQGTQPDAAPILLLAHQDVVPVEAGTERAWPYEPFSGEIAGGFVWGRGAVDDKGSLIGILEATEALLNKGFKPQRTIILAFGHDEEVKGSGAQAVAEELQKRGVKAWFALDEGMTGITDFQLTPRPAALIGIAEKGYMTVKVIAKGEGGHSSMPQKVTAADRLSRAIVALRAHPFKGGLDEGPAGEMLTQLAPNLEFTQRLAIANRWAFDSVLVKLMGASPSGDALLRTTIAPTMMNGGAKENVLPQEMTAIVNLRLHPRDSVESALSHMRAAVSKIDGVTIQIEGEANNPSNVSSTDSEAYGLVAAAARANAPEGAIVLPMLVLAATDSRHYSDVAFDVYRHQPVWAAQEEFKRVHGTGERLSVENLGRMVRFYAQIMESGAGSVS